jgi:hypothetical protein
LLDRHPFDVGALADDRVAVVVPGEGELLHALEQHRAGVVLAHLELVSHHRHLGVEVLLRHERVHHAVGFHAERPVEVVGGGGEGLEVGGAVVRGGAVPARAAAVELFLHVRVALRALEQQVLEQVRHAFLAVALVARAHEVGDVHGGGVASGSGTVRTRRPFASRYSVTPRSNWPFGAPAGEPSAPLRTVFWLLRRRSSLLSECGGGESSRKAAA